MSDGVVIALIGAVASVLSVLFTTAASILLILLRQRVKRVEDNSSATRTQLENDHVEDPHKVTNIRDEITKNHAEVKSAFRAMRWAMNAMDQRVASLADRVGDSEKDIRELTGPAIHPGRHRGS